MAKTSRDAWRHAREWSSLFADLKSLANSEIEAFLKQQKKKKYLKQSLRRLKERGFLLEKSNSLVVTKNGLKFFRKQNLLARSNELPSKWDGKWRLISFDVPVKNEAERQQLRSFLKEFNFFQLHKSVWVSPYKLAEDFWQLLIDYELNEYCKMMTVEIIEGGEEMKHFFHLD